MRQIAGRKLWLGHAGDLRDVRAILSAGIDAVVELAAGEPPAVLPRELVHCRFPLTDGGENSLWLVRLAAEAIAGLIQAGVPTLVGCSAGMSRSISLAAGGLAMADGRDLREVVAEIVRNGPADVSPGLIRQVCDAVRETG
jgi:hypothetical protein